MESRPRVGVLAKDAGGTYHAVQVDTQGRLLSNIVSGEVIATLGTLSVVKSGTLDVVKNVPVVQELKAGTIDVAKTVQAVNELKAGTIDVTKTVQTIEKVKSATIAAVKSRGGTVGVGAASANVAVGTISTVGFSRFTGMLKTGGTTITVGHEFQAGPGAMWVEDGTDTVDGSGLVTTFDHIGHRFRVVPQSDASTLDVTFRGRA